MRDCVVKQALFATIVIQTFGLAWALVFTPLETEQDLYGLLYFDWDWSEATAQRIEDWGGDCIFSRGSGCCGARFSRCRHMVVVKR